MNAIITPHCLNGTIKAVCSKSVAHRALICAALIKKQPTDILGITLSQDVLATIDCLRALGAIVEVGKSVRVVPVNKLSETSCLNCRESGSTLRFMLPIVAALGVTATFCGAERLFQRPNEPLLNTLKQSGIELKNWTISGKLQAGDYSIDGTISSQYISGMLLALSMVQGESRLFVQGESVSKQYIDITVGVLRDFGVDIQQGDFGYCIKGSSNNPDLQYLVEGDWSNAAFALVGGAIGGDVTLEGVNAHSLQGDKRIMGVLQQCGADVEIKENSIRVRKNRLNSFDICAQQIPDMVPALSVLAAYCNGTSTISGVERLRIKESDRLENILKMLKSAKISAEYSNGVLKIKGGKVCGGSFIADNDHRMAMSQTVLALYADGQSTISGAECVDKSYPTFFDDIKKLGGENCVLLEGK